MGHQPFRIRPNVGAEHMKTYALAAPLATHTRAASCAEVDCPPHQHGWACTVIAGSDDETALLKAAAGAVDGHRRHYVRQAEAGGFVRFVFPSGQACLRVSTHRVPLERDAIYLVKGGDWRGNPRRTPTRRHARAEHWVEDFGEHQQGIADAVERG